jgi:hypothetical protein
MSYYTPFGYGFPDQTSAMKVSEELKAAAEKELEEYARSVMEPGEATALSTPQTYIPDESGLEQVASETYRRCSSAKSIFQDTCTELEFKLAIAWINKAIKLNSMVNAHVDLDEDEALRFISRIGLVRVPTEIAVYFNLLGKVRNNLDSRQEASPASAHYRKRGYARDADLRFCQFNFKWMVDLLIDIANGNNNNEQAIQQANPNWRNGCGLHPTRPPSAASQRRIANYAPVMPQNAGSFFSRYKYINSVMDAYINWCELYNSGGGALVQFDVRRDLPTTDSFLLTALDHENDPESLRSDHRLSYKNALGIIYTNFLSRNSPPFEATVQQQNTSHANTMPTWWRTRELDHMLQMTKSYSTVVKDLVRAVGQKKIKL